MRRFSISVFLLVFANLQAQVDTTKGTEEEDYSMYENASYSGSSTKTYCSAKIFDLSPARFVSVAWDQQLPYTMDMSALGTYPTDTKTATLNESAEIKSTGGLRLYANIPVVSTNKLIWQVGANYWKVNYNVAEQITPTNGLSVIDAIRSNGLTTAGLHSTLFKALNEKQFILTQFSADLNGNYTLAEIQDLKFMRYSAAVLWGKRPNDRKQWAIGISRTYRVGEVNYIPIILYNWTSPGRKWGTEILFPARAHVRKNFNARSLMLAGYELEGQTYRIKGVTVPASKELELRRGELRFRAEYQRQLWGFIWGTVQAGYRYNYSFNADYISNSGVDFFRGFVGTQTYAMINKLGGALYFNVGIHLVSP